MSEVRVCATTATHVSPASALLLHSFSSSRSIVRSRPALRRAACRSASRAVLAPLPPLLLLGAVAAALGDEAGVEEAALCASTRARESNEPCKAALVMT